MPEILERSRGRQQQLARISVEEFHRIAELGIYGKRAELIRGVAFEKPPLSPLHRKLSKRIYDYLLSLRLEGCSVFYEAPLTLRDSEPQPDVSIAAGPLADFDERHPATAELVIEVAVSSEREDREMTAIYAEAGVKEYWIVLANRRQVEVYRRPVAGEYRDRQIYAGEEEVVSTAQPAIRIAAPWLFD